MAGFYGKLPVLGDFVSRGLSREFINNWDDWLQSALASSQEALGERWLEHYLTAPIWHFAFSPGICGSQGWVGILMSSVDRVGRYFPLTIALPVDDIQNLSLISIETDHWFSEMEFIALEALEKELKIEKIEELIANVNHDCWMQNTARVIGASGHPGDSALRQAFLVQFQNTEVSAHDRLQGLSHYLINHCFSGYSLWQTGGGETVNPSLMISQGLPPVHAYSGLLTEQMPDRGWNLQKAKYQSPVNRSQSIEQQDPVEINLPVNIDHATWHSQSAIDCGKRRQINEDALLDMPEQGIWVVADGMGGHQAGDVASAMIVKAIAQLHTGEELEQSVEQVKHCLYQVNEQLRQLAAHQYHNQIIGSTVVVLIAGKERFACLWAGDSRLYRLRNNQLQQLTEDHSESNLHPMDITDASLHSLKSNNVITRAVGAFEELELDCEYIDFQPGDRFLLCSDGVDKELSPYEIEQILKKDHQQHADALMKEVLDRQARDNVSIIVVEIF